MCTAKSSKGEEVLLGSKFTFSCNFTEQCIKQAFLNTTLIKQEPSNSPKEMSVDVENITDLSIYSCKCKGNTEPCGIDIKPGCKLVNFYNISLYQGSQFFFSSEMQSLYNCIMLILNNWKSLGGSLVQRCGNPALYHATLFNFARDMSFRHAK